MHVLISVLPASGHVNPMIAIAKALQQAGHRVTMVTGEAYRQQLERAGLAILPLHYPPEEYEKILALFSQPTPRFPRILWDRPQRAFFHLLPALTAQLVSILDNSKPDVMLTDLNFYAGATAAEARGVPYATFCAIVNPLPSVDTPTFGAEMPWQPPGHPARFIWRLTRFGSRLFLGLDDRVVNQVRREYGLPSVHFPMWYPSPYLFIAPTTGAYEYPRRDLPPQAVYVGPVTTSERGESPDDFPWDWLIRDSRPTVYMSMGTLARVSHIFQNMIHAARGKPWKVILAVGQGVDLGQFGDVPENVLLRNFVPQVDLLPKVDAVVSHGGNNTVTESLLYGKPLVIIPVIGDQPESAGRVVKAGAGIRLNIHRLTPGKLARAVDALLFDASYTQAAERIQASYQKTAGQKTIVRLLERLNAERVPLHRPAYMPPTLYQPEDVEKLCRSGGI